MYETVKGLFTGICDAIREKDGTTELISHQEIPARIAAIQDCRGESKDGILFEISPPSTFFSVCNTGGVVYYLNTSRDLYISLNKSRDFSLSGYDSAIFKCEKEISSDYENISITYALGRDGSNITTKAYFIVADDVGYEVEKEHYDFSKWVLLGENQDYVYMSDIVTQTFPLATFNGKNLFFGVYHGDEHIQYTSKLFIKSIVLS